MKAYIMEIKGVVQSVGFRPTIFRIFEHETGWVKNTQKGVKIYLETEVDQKTVVNLILSNKPPNAQIEKLSIKSHPIKKRAFNRFFIKQTESAIGDVSIPPDLGICDECAKELLDLNNRRYLHPFINCTNCGPRYSIISGSPYDREKTTMKYFPMCKHCRAEFEDPKSRRFHAQPICCNNCGPDYFLVDNRKPLYKNQEAIKALAGYLESGGVALVKGIGGYHLVCDAKNEDAVEKTLKLKHRTSKPFATIAKSLEIVEKYCYLNEKEGELLTSQIKPIVFLKPKKHNFLKSIRMDSPYLGVMLPYAPLHLLIFYFSNLEFIVATSANETERPLIYRDQDAIQFQGVDKVLTNNRKILRPLEDSIVQVVNDKQLTIRYARGFAPGVFLKKTKKRILALGADMKNNIAIALKNRVILSQYTGDLSEFENLKRFEEKVDDLLRFFNFEPELVVCDKHPEYFSTEFGEKRFGNILKKVQHHKAHFGSVLFEHSIDGEVIGVILDGTGYGDDGNIWGGEFFLKVDKAIERIGHIEYLPFGFGDLGVKEPYRLACLWLYEIMGENAFNHGLFEKYPFMKKAVKIKSNLQTSSAGRLFDVVSALLGVKTVITFEAEAAISLTNEAFKSNAEDRFDYSLNGYNIDFKPTLEQIALIKDINKPEHAKMFHNTFIDATVKNILRISKDMGVNTVALSGGVFQNEIVLSNVEKGLVSEGIKVFRNVKAPINDGGVALGQIYLAEMED